MPYPGKYLQFQKCGENRRLELWVVHLLKNLINSMDFAGNLNIKNGNFTAFEKS